MARDLSEIRQALRDEAFHLRVLTAELRNRTKTLTRAYDDALARIDELADELDNPTPEEAQGHDHRNALAEAR